MITNRILLPGEAGLLHDMLVLLAEYHNSVAENRDITYPVTNIDDTIQTINKNIKNGKCIVNAYFENGGMIAFCSIEIYKREENRGELKYLFVREPYRKQGFGDLLMKWAIHEFDKANVDLVDIRVVLGNPAIAFYEKYGFKSRIAVISRKGRNKT